MGLCLGCLLVVSAWDVSCLGSLLGVSSSCLNSIIFLGSLLGVSSWDCFFSVLRVCSWSLNRLQNTQFYLMYFIFNFLISHLIIDDRISESGKAGRAIRPRGLFAHLRQGQISCQKMHFISSTHRDRSFYPSHTIQLLFPFKRDLQLLGISRDLSVTSVVEFCQRDSTGAWFYQINQ